jgi:hypothetical protein
VFVFHDMATNMFFPYSLRANILAPLLPPILKLIEQEVGNLNTGAGAGAGAGGIKGLDKCFDGQDIEKS